MDAFSYLSVLLSIILGLAITQVLQGYRALLLARRRVTLYAPPLIWSALMLVIAMQNWWSSFGLTTHHDWSFLPFSVVALQTVLVYMMAAVVLPDMPADQPIDLRAHYHAESRPFFLLFLVVVLVSVGKDWILDGELTDSENLAFHGAFAATAILGLSTNRPRVHLAIAPAMAAAFVAYIGLLFASLAAG